MLSFLLAGGLLLAMVVCVLLNLVTLPGNWAMVALVGVWSYLVPGHDFGLMFFVMFIGLAVLGELLEFGTQIWGSRKYGSSNASTFAGILGAIAGAIAGAPFLLGIGAVFGALLGAWGACYFVERVIRNQPSEIAFRAAQGALVGKFLGMVIKFGVGVAMIVLTAANIWPDPVISASTSPVIL